jgi:hypothetical protein
MVHTINHFQSSHNPSCSWNRLSCVPRAAVSADGKTLAFMQIGSSQFPLPSHMRQRWLALNGNEAENTTTFTASREYKGESMLIFPPDPEALPAGPWPGNR